MKWKIYSVLFLENSQTESVRESSSVSKVQWNDLCTHYTTEASKFFCCCNEDRKKCKKYSEIIGCLITRLVGVNTT